MTTAFVSTLRVRPEALQVGGDGRGALSIRVQMPEVWDAVRIDATAETTVAEAKRRALAVLWPDAGFDDEYVMKLRGFEVLDERQTLGEVGVLNGSSFLLTYRRRRPVR